MSIYDEVQHVEVPRTYHHQPKKHYGTFETGYIIPIYKKFLLPNDLIKIDWDMVVRQLQMRVPSYSGIKIKCKAFSLAVRVLDKNFYRFMTGYKEYSTQTKYEEPLKTWIPDIQNTKAGSLWDYMQFQINNNFEDDPESQPLDIWRQFYGYIWDLYFRNQAIQESILVDGEPNSWQGETLLRINNQRDYFTTALPFQQLGDPVGLPIVGDTKAVWDDQINTASTPLSVYAMTDNGIKSINAKNHENILKQQAQTVNITGILGASNSTLQDNAPLRVGKDINNPTQHDHIITQEMLNKNTVSFNEISSVTVSMLRQAFALQMFAEMQARGGIRDIEFLLQHFGTAPADETLQRPKYLGGWDMNILNSEVLQTSQNTAESYLGEIGGTGLGAGKSNTITHHAKEYEMIMIVAYARTDTLYAQGIKREDTIKINTEFGLPVLGHISEQPIYQRELCACSKYAVFKDSQGRESTMIRTGYNANTYNNANANIIGYRPVYDWFRQDKNQISGAFHMYQVTTSNTNSEDDAKQEYTYQMYDWTNARFFDTRINKLPKINNDFLQYKDDLRNNILTEDNTGQFTLCNTHNLLFAINFNVKTWRPISQFGTPGRLDHIV